MSDMEVLVSRTLEEHETYQCREVRGCEADVKKEGTFEHERGDTPQRRRPWCHRAGTLPADWQCESRDGRIS